MDVVNCVLFTLAPFTDAIKLSKTLKQVSPGGRRCVYKYEE